MIPKAVIYLVGLIPCWLAIYLDVKHNKELCMSHLIGGICSLIPIGNLIGIIGLIVVIGEQHGEKIRKFFDRSLFTFDEES